jgi:hypothetical protein
MSSDACTAHVRRMCDGGAAEGGRKGGAGEEDGRSSDTGSAKERKCVPNAEDQTPEGELCFGPFGIARSMT